MSSIGDFVRIAWHNASNSVSDLLMPCCWMMRSAIAVIASSRNASTPSPTIERPSWRSLSIILRTGPRAGLAASNNNRRTPSCNSRSASTRSVTTRSETLSPRSSKVGYARSVSLPSVHSKTAGKVPRSHSVIPLRSSIGADDANIWRAWGRTTSRIVAKSSPNAYTSPSASLTTM